MAAAVVTCPGCGTRNRVRPNASAVPRCAKCGRRLPWAVDAGEDDFAEEVRAAFPAESDVGSPSAGSVVVLVPRPEAVVRDLLRAILERVTLLDVHGALPIRPTASAGWAPASVLGYDLDTLVYTGREAARVASTKGGDRWERVGAAIVERLISQSERS